jgi:hypothetical protein
MWKKGQSGNPLGRPKAPEIDVLRRSIKKVEKERNIQYWEEIVKLSLTNPTLAAAIIKKFIPDLSSQEVSAIVQQEVEGYVYAKQVEDYNKGITTFPHKLQEPKEKKR